MILDISLQPRIEATEFTMENFDITNPKKAEIVSNAGKVMNFFFMNRVFCISTMYIIVYTITAVYYQEVLQKVIAHFKKKKKNPKKLKKYFCITTILAHMLHTSSPNFWGNEASTLFLTFHMVQTSPYATSDYS